MAEKKSSGDVTGEEKWIIRLMMGKRTLETVYEYKTSETSQHQAVTKALIEFMRIHWGAQGERPQ